MPDPATAIRHGEYAARGEYHRSPDQHWDYLPTYLAKLQFVRRFLHALPPGTRVLDAGCGEGILVEEFSQRLAIEGVDAHYSSPHVRQASVTALPHLDGALDCVLCLDVLEHLAYAEQHQAVAELYRVLRPGGTAVVSVPNLAHLQSRVHFLLRGRLIRTASEHKHPGDRPATEYRRLFGAAGFHIDACRGIFPTVPVLTARIRRHPVRLQWLHTLLTRLLPLPNWCFLTLFVLRK